ncbi:MAG: hypothetical protein U7126_08825 [Microcoleus sp.]
MTESAGCNEVSRKNPVSGHPYTQKTGFFPIYKPVTKYSRKNPVSGYPYTQKTGFFPIYKPVTKYSRKNPVSGYPYTQKTGFFPIYKPVTKYSRKNPVSGYPCTKETGFFPESAGCHQIFSQKPGFWLPVHQRNRVFSRICGLSPNILAKTRFLATPNYAKINLGVIHNFP